MVSSLFQDLIIACSEIDVHISEQKPKLVNQLKFPKNIFTLGRNGYENRFNPRKLDPFHNYGTSIIRHPSGL
jgi:hypothetical protein